MPLTLISYVSPTSSVPPKVMVSTWATGSCEVVAEISHWFFASSRVKFRVTDWLLPSESTIVTA